MKRAAVTSEDGTTIAYEKAGNGDVVILVLGALNSRKSGSRLAKLLASHFTVISYDRRGRGERRHHTYARYSSRNQQIYSQYANPYISGPDTRCESKSTGTCFDRILFRNII